MATHLLSLWGGEQRVAMMDAGQIRLAVATETHVAALLPPLDW